MEYSPIQDEFPTVGDEVVVAILPVHAKRLYKGLKLFELRKVVPKRIPRIIFLYETNGVRRITGHLIVNRILTGSPDSLWKQVGSHATTKKRFYRYFAGRSVGYAFEVGCAVKYKQPIDLTASIVTETGFKVPQNFLYLQNLPQLHRLLMQRLLEESLQSISGSLKLRMFQEKHEAKFIQAVDRHISGSYLETGKMYGRKLIRIHKQGNDPEGILTLRKRILEVYFKDKLAGFVVLTEKGGGSVKTGPTILFKEFRNQGVGKKLRAVLHEALGKAGARKVYCTVPIKNVPAVQYLIGSDYKIEAHLHKHYHHEHDELVFGYVLAKYRASGLEFVRQLEPIDKFALLTRPTNEVIEFIDREFKAVYCNMPERWAARQAREAAAYAKGTGSTFKARLIFTGEDLKLDAVALCLLKRGGSAKILLLTATSHQRSITRMVQFIEKTVISSKTTRVRKMYTHVPLADTAVMQAFYDAGYNPEGVIERPYNDSTDMVVLAKELA